MPSDAERFQFLDQFKLTANWDDEEFTLFSRQKSVSWQYGRLFVISKGKNLGQPNAQVELRAKRAATVRQTVVSSNVGLGRAGTALSFQRFVFISALFGRRNIERRRKVIVEDMNVLSAGAKLLLGRDYYVLEVLRDP